MDPFPFLVRWIIDVRLESFLGAEAGQKTPDVHGIHFELNSSNIASELGFALRGLDGVVDIPELFVNTLSSYWEGHGSFDELTYGDDDLSEAWKELGSAIDRVQAAMIKRRAAT